MKRFTSNRLWPAPSVAEDAGRGTAAKALAQFECEPYANYDGGDHVIFVVRVVHYAIQPDAPAPLVFFRGRYCDVTNEPKREPAWPLPIHY